MTGPAGVPQSPFITHFRQILNLIPTASENAALVAEKQQIMGLISMSLILINHNKNTVVPLLCPSWWYLGRYLNGKAGLILSTRDPTLF